ncbi:hypothetical protein TNCV_523981 [Trichonephila clavipes]|nr:hypothetical protein TNCV_523981 [Trichonephila clavipes]
MEEADNRKLRGRAKLALTRIINSFSENLCKSELLSRVELLDQIFKEFDKFNADFPEEESEIEEFESLLVEDPARGGSRAGQTRPQNRYGKF